MCLISRQATFVVSVSYIYIIHRILIFVKQKIYIKLLGKNVLKEGFFNTKVHNTRGIQDTLNQTIASKNKTRKYWNINTFLLFICHYKTKNIVKLFVKFYYVRLFFQEKCCNIIFIGNEIKADVGVTFNSSTIVERLEVVFIC